MFRANFQKNSDFGKKKIKKQLSVFEKNFNKFCIFKTIFQNFLFLEEI